MYGPDEPWDPAEHDQEEPPFDGPRESVAWKAGREILELAFGADVVREWEEEG